MQETAQEVRRVGTRVERLEYVRAMLREMRGMVATERFDMLTFHLEMAYLEASDNLRELHAERAAGSDEDGRPPAP